MTLAASSYAVAAAAGLVAALIAARGLRSGRRVAGVAAAVARGLAVALATIAAFGPVSRTAERVPGRTLVAAPSGAVAPDGDLTIRWPDDAPDAASALETLRAARDAASPASLVLATGSDIGRARDIAPVVHALRATADVDASVVALPTSSGPAPLGPPPRIVAPAGATEGVPTVLTLDAGARPFATGVARVEIDGRSIEVPLTDGATRTVTPPLDLVAGTHVAVARIDRRLPAATIVGVAGPPRVLVVRAGPRPSEMASMLRVQGLDVVEVAAGDLRVDDVDRCAAIVLGPGVAGETLCAAVAPRVRGGAGLLVVGGDGAQGLSRFRGTALEPLLPVVAPSPPPPPPPELPTPPPPDKKPDAKKPKPALDEGDKQAMRVALLLVIDTSGSMAAGGKLQMAQQSAIAAANALSPEDRVSVFAFADDSREIAPFQDAVETRALVHRIAALRADGQTNFFPALKTGYRRILEQPCGIRHVVLLTDGETRPAVFRDLIEGGAQQGVTLSTVAVGDDADTNLLASLATWGHGKLYVANDPSRLPEIVTLDTRRFATGERDRKRRDRKEADVEDLPEPPSEPPSHETAPPGPPKEAPVSRRPHVVSAASLLAGLESETWPGLPFAESAAARPASQVVLAWEDGAPALTIGRAGLGRVAALAAGADSPEAREFLAWPAAPQFVAQTVRSLIEVHAADAALVDAAFVEAVDGRAFATVAVPSGGVLSLDPLRAGGPIVARCEDRGTSSIAALAVMPAAGVYVGTFAAAGGEPRRALAVSPGPRGPDPELPRHVADAARVALVDRPPEPRDGAPKEREEPRQLPFLVGAAALLVAEAALRRRARSAA